MSVSRDFGFPEICCNGTDFFPRVFRAIRSRQTWSLNMQTRINGQQSCQVRSSSVMDQLMNRDFLLLELKELCEFQYCFIIIFKYLNEGLKGTGYV